MPEPQNRGSAATTQSYDNSPVYDEQGRRVWIKECWRKPRRPFRRPDCCGPVKRIGIDLYRCTRCAAKIKPERLWHRLLLGRNPFRPDGTVRDLFRVTRWSA